MRELRWRKIATFLAIAFGLAWTLALAFFACGGRLNSIGFVVMGVGYMFTPALAAVVTNRLSSGSPRTDLGLRAPRVWPLLAAWITPVILVVAASGLSLLLPNVSFGGIGAIYDNVAPSLTPAQLTQLHAKLDHGPLAIPGVLPAFFILQALIAGISVNAVAAFGEELGWRGFLLDEFRRIGFWPASFTIGLVWGLWHLPLIAQGYNYPGHPVAGPAMMTLLTVLLAPLLGYARLRANSIFAAAVLHGTFNAVATLGLFLRGGSLLLTGILGVCGMLTLALADLALWTYLRGRTDPLRETTR